MILLQTFKVLLHTSTLFTTVSITVNSSSSMQSSMGIGQDRVTATVARWHRPTLIIIVFLTEASPPRVFFKSTNAV